MRLLENSRALAIPTEVNNLGLDYSKEFEMAKTLIDGE
jgi:hypothetical protein